MGSIFKILGHSVFGIYLRILSVLFKPQPELYVLGGGQLLRCNSTFPHAMLLWAIVSRIRRVPLMLYSVGLDVCSKGGWLHGFSLRFLCDTAVVISVRDEFSRAYLDTMGYPLAKVVPDAVFLSPPEALRGDVPTCRGVVVFVSSFSLGQNGHRGGFTSREEYFSCLWELAKSGVDAAGGLVVTCSSTGDVTDASLFAEWVCTQGVPSSVAFSPATSVKEFLGLVRRARLVVSTRMHPIIVAKLFGIEYSVVPFNQKTEDMSKWLRDCDLGKLIEDSRKTICDDIGTIQRGNA